MLYNIEAQIDYLNRTQEATGGRITTDEYGSTWNQDIKARVRDYNSPWVTAPVAKHHWLHPHWRRYLFSQAVKEASPGVWEQLQARIGARIWEIIYMPIPVEDGMNVAALATMFQWESDYLKVTGTPLESTAGTLWVKRDDTGSRIRWRWVVTLNEREIAITEEGKLNLPHAASAVPRPLLEHADTEDAGTWIEDSGTHLPGARKHAWKPGTTVTVEDLEEIEKQPAGTIFRYVDRDWVWGPFDWEAEKAAGVEAPAAELKNKVRLALAKKPENTPEDRKAYVEGVAWLKASFAEIKTPYQLGIFLRNWVHWYQHKEVAVDYTDTEAVDALEAAGVATAIPDENGRRIGDSLTLTPSRHPELVAAEARMEAAHGAWVAAGRPEGGREAVNAIQRNYKAAANALKKTYLLTDVQTALGATGPSTLYAREHTVTVWKASEAVNNHKAYLLAVAGVSIQSTRMPRDNSLWKILGYSDSFPSSWAWVSTTWKQRLTWDELLKPRTGGGGKGKAWSRATTDQKRVGPEVRKPASMAGGDFLREFGLTGDQFGNWVNQEDRTKHMSLAWDAFADLARLMGVPSHWIGSSVLGIAFGARGHGKASAHYESVNPVLGRYFPVINLTQTKGDGSLAHEWGHFLDHHLSRSFTAISGEGGKMTARFASDSKRGGTGFGTLDDAMGKVMEAIYEVSREQRVANQARANGLWAEANRIAKELNAKIREGMPRDIYHKAWADEVEKRYADSKKLKKASAETEYFTNAKERGEYWKRPTELFARAFESWAEDRLQALGEANTYLVYGTQGKLYGDPAPYPQSDERVAINLAMDALVKALATSAWGDTLNKRRQLEEEEQGGTVDPENPWMQLLSVKPSAKSRSWKVRINVKDPSGKVKAIEVGWGDISENQGIHPAYTGWRLMSKGDNGATLRKGDKEVTLKL